MKLALEGGNAWDWNKPLATVCQRESLSKEALFDAAAAWAKDAKMPMPDPDGQSTHYGLYRSTIARRKPPHIPSFVRAFIKHKLSMNCVVDVAPVVTPRDVAPLQSGKRTFAFSRNRAGHRPSIAQAI